MDWSVLFGMTLHGAASRAEGEMHLPAGERLHRAGALEMNVHRSCQTVHRKSVELDSFSTSQTELSRYLELDRKSGRTT
ncbi:hypothetical protein, partial [Burkholderia sola]|uniref:hypothetical protein n=1 Tax=Burkholderia sola TaxID=2843302 RepID=UPI0023DDCE15